MEYALRYSTVIKNYDFSFMYYQGREDYPVLTGLKTTEVIFNYPQKNVFSLDIAGTMEDIGIWSEIAYSRPKLGDNYLQSIIGTDYTFKNGFHLLGEYYYDDSFDNFIPDQNVKIKDFLGIGGDYNLTDLLKITASIFTPLADDFYMINGECTYSIAQDIELKTGFNHSVNKELFLKKIIVFFQLQIIFI